MAPAERPTLPESSETEDESEYNLSPEGYHLPLYPKNSPFYGQPLPGCRIVRRGDPDHGIKVGQPKKTKNNEPTTPQPLNRVDTTEKNGNSNEPTTPRAFDKADAAELTNPSMPPPAKNKEAQKSRQRILDHLRSLKKTMNRLRHHQKVYHRSHRREDPATIAVCRAIKDTSRAIINLDYVSRKALEDER